MPRTRRSLKQELRLSVEALESRGLLTGIVAALLIDASFAPEDAGRWEGHALPLNSLSSGAATRHVEGRPPLGQPPVGGPPVRPPFGGFGHFVPRYDPNAGEGEGEGEPSGARPGGFPTSGTTQSPASQPSGPPIGASTAPVTTSPSIPVSVGSGLTLPPVAAPGANGGAVTVGSSNGNASSVGTSLPTNPAVVPSGSPIATGGIGLNPVTDPLASSLVIPGTLNPGGSGGSPVVATAWTTPVDHVWSDLGRPSLDSRFASVVIDTADEPVSTVAVRLKLTTAASDDRSDDLEKDVATEGEKEQTEDLELLSKRSSRRDLIDFRRAAGGQWLRSLDRDWSELARQNDDAIDAILAALQRQPSEQLLVADEVSDEGGLIEVLAAAADRPYVE